jgi:hypothetical protein
MVRKETKMLRQLIGMVVMFEIFAITIFIGKLEEIHPLKVALLVTILGTLFTIGYWLYKY